MSKLTISQINQIKSIIKEHMGVIMQITTGDGKPSPRLLKKLKLPKAITDLITTSYQYGKLGTIKGKDLANMSAADVKALMRQVKLTPSQQHSVEFMKIKAQQHIDSLTQKITSNVIASAIQSDLSMWSEIKQVIPAAIENNSPRYKVLQELRDKTQDMYRDWHRVAQTEMWSAKCQGEAEAILNKESPLSKQGAETEVYIRPSKNACQKCKQLYVESDGVTPKVFLLSELMSNGSNYGKKQADWLPCIPPLHPNCSCVMNVKPKDTKFDAQGNLMYSASKNNV